MRYRERDIKIQQLRSREGYLLKHKVVNPDTAIEIQREGMATKDDSNNTLRIPVPGI